MPFAMFQCAKSIVQSFTGIASEDFNDFVSQHLEDLGQIQPVDQNSAIKRSQKNNFKCMSPFWLKLKYIEVPKHQPKSGSPSFGAGGAPGAGRQQQQHGLSSEFLRGKLRAGFGGGCGWRATDGGKAAVAAVAAPEGGDGDGVGVLGCILQ